MDQVEERYDVKTAAAWILGHVGNTGIPDLPAGLSDKTADECTSDELLLIIEAGLAAGLKLYPFKTGTQVLPRVSRVMGFLHSVPFETLLDVGSGRGVFLIPFLKAFPQVSVTAVDLLEKRVNFLKELSAGGFRNLQAFRDDICRRPFPEKSFDVVTMLEVLEHIPEPEKAVEAAVRAAKRYVVVTVPSKPDNNPEHLHLLTKEKLTGMFSAAGCRRLHFDGVAGHLFMAAAIEKDKSTETGA